MTRYVEITHTYVIPVPAEDVAVIEPLAREGMSIMEGFMAQRAANITELRSDWKLMPKEYRPPQPVPQSDELTITSAPPFKFYEHDPEESISFTEDVMGQKTTPHVPHPWDQGLRILPEGHDLYDAETEALKQEGMNCEAIDESWDAECIAAKGHPGPHTWRSRKKTKEIEGD